MSIILPYLQTILFALLLTSSAGITLYAISFVLTGPKANTISSFAKLVAALTSVGTLLVSVLNLSFPLGPIGQDPAR